MTDINPSEDNNDEEGLICVSELSTYEASLGERNWYLHPDELSTNVSDRIVSPPADRGWHRNRDTDSEGHRLVRLWKESLSAEEGVFTCLITGAFNIPISVGIYYPSESCIVRDPLKV